MFNNWTKAKTIVGGVVLSVVATFGVAQAEECKDPEALRFSMIPTEETTQELSLYEPLVAQLREFTGKNV